jgi:hypothetical protein
MALGQGDEFPGFVLEGAAGGNAGQAIDGGDLAQLDLVHI